MPIVGVRANDAEGGGEGQCRVIFLMYDYFANTNNVKCYLTSTFNNFCYGLDNTNGDQYNCNALVSQYSNSLIGLCEAAVNHEINGDNYWLEWARTYGFCENAYERPYALAFSDSSEMDEALSWDQAPPCYNGNDDIVVVTCDCQGNDSLGDYYPDESTMCPETLYNYDGDVSEIDCMLNYNFDLVDGDGTIYSYQGTKYVCASKSYIDARGLDGCYELCNCHGMAGEIVAIDGWESTGTGGNLISWAYEYYDLQYEGDGRGCRAELLRDYACEDGYYYNGPNDCRACPVHHSNTQTSEYANQGDVSSCFVRAGTYTDSIGTYNYTANCHYE